MWVLPTQGLFVPNADPVSAVIDRVAKRQFGLDTARRELRDALGVIESFEQRDQIESAINRLRAASDEAHFYAGVAFGVVLTDLW